VSQDGTVWYEVQSLRALSDGYQFFSVDLDAVLRQYGLSYTRNFKVRFNQYDNYAIPSDGIAVDDVSVTGCDATPPVLSVPPDVTVDFRADTGPGATGTAAASDNDPCEPVVGYGDSVAAGTPPFASVITRTWTAADCCGNRASGSQVILVTDASYDSDADGLADGWEYEHFGSVTGAAPEADPDADGVVNREEAGADTDPTNAVSVLALRLEMDDALRPFLFFPTSTARVYAVDYRESAGDTPWIELQPPTPAAGEETSVPAAQGSPLRVYRLRVSAP
jgi:hypothetical protein